jgi:hypothetical protein
VPSSRRRRLIRLAFVLALWPVSADAQTVGSFSDLTRILRAQETVIVSDLKGRRTKGTVTAVDEDSLSLVTNGGTQTFREFEVSTVRVADGISNGVLIGAAAGLGAALGILATVSSGDGYVLPSAKVGAPVLLSGIGALVGALVDHAHAGRILCASPGRKSGLAIAPLVGKDRRGVLLSVDF